MCAGVDGAGSQRSQMEELLLKVLLHGTHPGELMNYDFWCREERKWEGKGRFIYNMSLATLLL